MGKSGKKKKKQTTKAERKRAAAEKARLEEEENNRRAEEALAAGMEVLGIAGMTIETPEELAVPVPPTNDCPICLVPLPIDADSKISHLCCLETICMACSEGSVKAFIEINARRRSEGQTLLPQTCPFCRSEYPEAGDEQIQMLEEKAAKNDPRAFSRLYGRLKGGNEGCKRKAFGYLLRAVELGHPRAFIKLSLLYEEGEFVRQSDDRKVMCYMAAAKGGDALGHFFLGRFFHEQTGNNELGIKHYHIAAAAGLKQGLDCIQALHRYGNIASREDFAKAIQAYKDAKAEEWSEERAKWEEKQKKKGATK